MPDLHKIWHSEVKSAQILKISIAEIQDGGQLHLQSQKITISHDDVEPHWSLKCIAAVRHLEFLKIKFLMASALERYVCITKTRLTANLGKLIPKKVKPIWILMIRFWDGNSIS